MFDDLTLVVNDALGQAPVVVVTGPYHDEKTRPSEPWAVAVLSADMASVRRFADRVEAQTFALNPTGHHTTTTDRRPNDLP